MNLNKDGDIKDDVVNKINTIDSDGTKSRPSKSKPIARFSTIENLETIIPNNN